MNITRKALEFERWFNSPQFPQELEKADVEECVWAWANETGINISNNFGEICNKIVELGIC